MPPCAALPSLCTRKLTNSSWYTFPSFRSGVSVYGPGFCANDRFQRVPADQNPVGLGGKNTLARGPADASWQFVAVGRGHDQDFWARFLQALHAVDPGIAVNIEHEDTELDQIEGLRLAAQNLIAARTAAGV